MALEKLLTDLIAALEANTTATEEQNAKLASMMGAKAADKPAAKQADKPADKPAAKPAEKPAAGKKAAPKAVTADDIAKAAGEYMKAGDDDDRAQAKANVKRIVEYFESDRLTNIDPEDFPEVLSMLKTFAAGDEPEALAGGDEEGEDSVI